MIYVFLANGFEEVEAFTPVDYLRRIEELEVATVGVDGKLVTGSHGIATICDLTMFDIDINKAEMIVLPGGMPGTLNLEKSAMLIDFIKSANNKGVTIAAICAAPSILGHIGIIDGVEVTCFKSFEHELSKAIYKDEPVVCDKNFITAAGAGVANQFAFALIEKLMGKERAELLKKSIQYIG